jgi:hypothetical protein
MGGIGMTTYRDSVKKALEEWGCGCLDVEAALSVMENAIAEAGFCIERAARVQNLETFARLDMEAATHVESVICMRTGFTGEPPYVGWRGLGLALTEALDERDMLCARIAVRPKEE